MVKALINGERNGSLVQVLVLVAALLVAAVAIALALSYRSAWHRSQNGEYHLCLQREAYDQANHQLEQADADLMRSMIAADATNPVFSAPARTQRSLAFTAKLSKDEAYLNTPVVDGCELVKP